MVSGQQLVFHLGLNPAVMLLFLLFLITVVLHETTSTLKSVDSHALEGCVRAVLSKLF